MRTEALSETITKLKNLWTTQPRFVGLEALAASGKFFIVPRLEGVPTKESLMFLASAITASDCSVELVERSELGTELRSAFPVVDVAALLAVKNSTPSVSSFSRWRWGSCDLDRHCYAHPPRHTATWWWSSQHCCTTRLPALPTHPLSTRSSSPAASGLTPLCVQGTAKACRWLSWRRSTKRLASLGGTRGCTPCGCYVSGGDTKSRGCALLWAGPNRLQRQQCPWQCKRPWCSAARRTS